MESSPGPWISALRHSHDRLRASVQSLGSDQLAQRSYPSEWTIAQVLSHLGSQAEIFGLILEAGLAGREPPAREEFPPVWDKWNAKDPQAQASDALRADQATLERLESMDAGERERLHLKLFGMDIDATGFARLRVSEHAVHTWDVLVALDPAATLAPDARAVLGAGAPSPRMPAPLKVLATLSRHSRHTSTGGSAAGPQHRDVVVRVATMRLLPTI
jgi:uncharacterized protein (TIGR03083 family)